MKKVSIKNLKAGKTVYYVHALGDNSFVSKYLITGRPVYHYYKNIPECLNSKSDGLFVPYKFVFDDGTVSKLVDSFSLVDCNVERQNGYNKHKAFFSKRSADLYCKICKQCNISVPSSGTKFDSECWDYPLELYDPYYDEISGQE